MAKTKEKPKKINKFELKLPVKFKNLSTGADTASIGITIARSHGKLNVIAAEEAFCGKRLRVCLLVGAGDPDQGVFWDDVQYRVDAIADAKKVSFTPKLIGTGLLFQLKGVNIEELSHFAQQEGTLIVVKTMDIPEGEGSDAELAKDDEETDEDESKE